MTTYTPEIIAFTSIAFGVVLLRLWISRQPDASAARLRVREIALWIVSTGALILSGAALMFPALRPTSPVGLFVAFSAIYLLVSHRRALTQRKRTEA